MTSTTTQPASVSVDFSAVSFADATIARLPRVIRPFADQHHELIKFGIVGATTFVIDSDILNREWSFRDRGGRERHHEALLFFGVSAVGVVLSMAPLYFSSYVLELRVPAVTLTVENIADFISAYVIGNLLQMGFRFWALRRWVFPNELGDDPDRTLESVLTTGGIAEALEDRRSGPTDQLSSESNVSKTS